MTVKFAVLSIAPFLLLVSDALSEHVGARRIYVYYRPFIRGQYYAGVNATELINLGNRADAIVNYIRFGDRTLLDTLDDHVALDDRNVTKLNERSVTARRVAEIVFAIEIPTKQTRILLGVFPDGRWAWLNYSAKPPPRAYIDALLELLPSRDLKAYKSYRRNVQ